MRSYLNNDQFVKIDFDGSIPVEEFYRNKGISYDDVKPVFKHPSKVDREDLFSKDVFINRDMDELIEDIEGPGTLVFSYRGEDLEGEVIFKKGEVVFEVDKQAKDELKFVENTLSKFSDDQEYIWTTNASSYLSMEDLEDGLSNSIAIDPIIQGVEEICYNPHSHVSLKHYGAKMIEISEDLLNREAENLNADEYLKRLEKDLRNKIDTEAEGQQRVKILGREISIEEDNWQLRDYPVNEDAIESIMETFQEHGFETERIKFGRSQQPMETDIFVTDFEEI